MYSQAAKDGFVENADHFSPNTQQYICKFKCEKHCHTGEAILQDQPSCSGVLRGIRTIKRMLLLSGTGGTSQDKPASSLCLSLQCELQRSLLFFPGKFLLDSEAILVYNPQQKSLSRMLDGYGQSPRQVYQDVPIASQPKMSQTKCHSQPFSNILFSWISYSGC